MKLFVRDKNFYRTLLILAVPIALQSLITVGVNMMDNIMLGSLGEVKMSGVTLANNFISIYQCCCMGFGMGASVMTSRYWGMKNIESLKKTVTIMFRGVLLLGLLFSFATLIMPFSIMGLFSKEEFVIQAGTSYFMISIPCYLLMGYSMTTSLVLRSVGKADIPLFSSIGAFLSIYFLNGFLFLEIWGLLEWRKGARRWVL